MRRLPMRLWRAGVLGFCLLPGLALAQAPPPSASFPRAAPGDPQAFSLALKRARAARSKLEKLKPPPIAQYQTSADAQRFVSEKFAPWLTGTRKLQDDTNREYRAALAAALTDEHRVTVLAEAAEMSLRLAERTYRLGEAAMPRQIAKDRDLSSTYLSTLDSSLESAREPARSALKQCVEIAERSHLHDAAAIRCRTLFEQPFVVDPKARATPDELRRRMRSLQQQFRRCYERGLAADPALKGDLGLNVTIGPKGVVTAVTTRGSLGKSAVGACVAAAVKTLRFPAPGAGKSISLSYPLTLDPGH